MTKFQIHNKTCILGQNIDTESNKVTQGGGGMIGLKFSPKNGSNNFDWICVQNKHYKVLYKFIGVLKKLLGNWFFYKKMTPTMFTHFLFVAKVSRNS